MPTVLSNEIGSLMLPTESNNPFGSRLALHSLGMLASPTRSFSNGFIFPPLGFTQFGLQSRILEPNLTRESLEAGILCLTSNINPDKRVKNLIDEIQKYEIPSGQSPKTRSESLAQLIRTSRSVCLAPIIAGSTIAATHLGQGNYVAAILDVATGAAATLILVSTISFAEVIARKLAENRGESSHKSRRKTNSQKDIEGNKPKLEADDVDSSSES